jgi:hypothetical protein
MSKKSASKSASDLPFDGAITRFFEEEAPESVRKAIGAAKKDTMLDPAYPYDTGWTSTTTRTSLRRSRSSW